MEDHSLPMVSPLQPSPYIAAHVAIMRETIRMMIYALMFTNMQQFKHVLQPRFDDTPNGLFYPLLAMIVASLVIQMNMLVCLSLFKGRPERADNVTVVGTFVVMLLNACISLFIPFDICNYAT